MSTSLITTLRREGGILSSKARGGELSYSPPFTIILQVSAYRKGICTVCPCCRVVGLCFVFALRFATLRSGSGARPPGVRARSGRWGCPARLRRRSVCPGVPGGGACRAPPVSPPVRLGYRARASPRSIIPVCVGVCGCVVRCRRCRAVCLVMSGCLSVCLPPRSASLRCPPAGGAQGHKRLRFLHLISQLR